MCVQYIGGYSVHRGMFSTLEEYHVRTSGVFSTSEGTISISGRGDIMSTLGDIMSTSGFSIEIEKIYQAAPSHAS